LLEPHLPPLPFVRFDWIDAWWRHLSADGLAIHDQLSLRVFHDENGDLVGIAPLMLTSRPGVGPAWTRQLQPIGADANITEIRGLVAPTDVESNVVNALLDHLRGCSDTWDWLLLSGVSHRVADDHTLTRFPQVQWRPETSSYVLRLAAWGEVKRGLSRNGRESLRKCYNSLKREGISFGLDVVRSRQATPAAIENFFRLHTARSNRTGTVPHPDVFRQDHARRFLIDVCERFADRDALRIFQITIGGDVVATRIGFVVGDSLYLYYSGYDPEFSRFSIMTTLLAEAVQYAVSEGFTSVNLSTGKDASKQRWRPREITYRDAEIVSPSIRGRLAHRIYGLAKSGLPDVLGGLNRLGPFARRVGR
jgi:CelD/BcsL family acetyltransferase involved in cellulose biosynthesis